MNALTRWNPFKKTSDIEEWRPIVRWNPFLEMERTMERMQREMERVLQIGQTRPQEAMTETEWCPCVDIAEDEKEFVLKVELPEVKKDDVKVTVDDDVLTIRGERKTEKEEKNKKYHRIERSYGSFERSFTMPSATDAQRISSEFKDGVLTVHLTKNPAAKPKAIEIKVQ